MGVWSRAVFTNHPEAIVDKSWFGHDGPCRILRHYSLTNIDTDSETMTMKELMEGVHENSKIWGHMDMDQRMGWDALLRNTLEKNPHIKLIELHFYCLDDEMPYYFYRERGDDKKSYMKILPMGHVYYSRVGKDDEGRKRVLFVDKKYKKTYKKVLVGIENLVPENTGRFFF